MWIYIYHITKVIVIISVILIIVAMTWGFTCFVRDIIKESIDVFKEINEIKSRLNDNLLAVQRTILTEKLSDLITYRRNAIIIILLIIITVSLILCIIAVHNLGMTSVW